MNDADAALAALREVGAVLEGHFRYASGRHGPIYVEKFRLLEHPEVTARLCAQIAERFSGAEIEVVVGPTTGGILLAHEAARALGTRMFFAERGAAGGRVFERGFSFAAGQPTLVVDDVLTTGGSVQETIDAVRAAGGDPVGVGVVVDRTNGATDFGLPFFACIALEVPSYPADECPLCESGEPLTVT